MHFKNLSDEIPTERALAVPVRGRVPKRTVGFGSSLFGGQTDVAQKVVVEHRNARATSPLTAAGKPWELAVGGESEQAIEATVAADLAVSARLTNAMPQGLVPIEARGRCLRWASRTSVFMRRPP